MILNTVNGYVQTMTFVNAYEDEVPEMPEDPDESEEEQEKPSSPQTGETTDRFLWIALLFVSGGVAATMSVCRKRFAKI